MIHRKNQLSRHAAPVRCYVSAKLLKPMVYHRFCVIMITLSVIMITKTVIMITENRYHDNFYAGDLGGFKPLWLYPFSTDRDRAPPQSAHAQNHWENKGKRRFSRRRPKIPLMYSRLQQGSLEPASYSKTATHLLGNSSQTLVFVI